jgi:hypothetical protein
MMFNEMINAFIFDGVKRLPNDPHLEGLAREIFKRAAANPLSSALRPPRRSS